MVIATGFFDGVHLGHRFVLRQLVEEARRRNDESMVVTFWPHPRNVLQDDARNLRLLTSMEEKKALIRAAKTIILEVNQNMPKALGYETELNLCDVDYVVEGSNHPMPQIPNRAGTPVGHDAAHTGRQPQTIVRLLVDGRKLLSGETEEQGTLRSAYHQAIRQGLGEG